MKYHIKLNCHDWPRRGDKSVMKLTVEADGDQEAMQLGMLEAQQQRSGAKLKVFDCERDRFEVFESAQGAGVSRETHQNDSHAPSISSSLKRGAYGRKSG